MAVIRVETPIKASLEVCFNLALYVGLHVKSTASTRERIVAGRTSGLLELGDEITFEARHLRMRRRLTVKIFEFDDPQQVYRHHA